mgnify:CR=1 FL=1
MHGAKKKRVDRIVEQIQSTRDVYYGLAGAAVGEKARNPGIPVLRLLVFAVPFAIAVAVTALVAAFAIIAFTIGTVSRA